MGFYIEQREVKEYFDKRKGELQEIGMSEIEINGTLSLEYTDKVIVKYTKEEQDIMLNYWIKLILEVEGGYWQFIELMQKPHSEFSHYSFRKTMSYEKGNVTNATAKKELTESAFENFKKSKKTKTLINKNTTL